MTTKKLLGISTLILTLLTLIAGGIGVWWVLSLERPIDDAVQNEYWNTQTTQIEARTKLWAEQNIIKYKIGIRFSHTSECALEAVIENNVVVQTIKDTCQEAAYANLKTVDGLFAFIKSIADAQSCGANGCDCDGPLVMDVVYDQQYKFPQAAKPVSHREEIWRFKRAKVISLSESFDYDGKTCAVNYDAGIDWEIYSFTPLN